MTTNNASDASVVRLKNSEKSLVVTVDCNGSYVYANPYVGAMIAVSEAARNIVCTGGEPAAITNCLNFGNPYNEGVYYQFVNALKGMGEACEKFNTPVTGGNVSFYNQSVYKDSTEPVFPTPTIGMLGLMENKDNHMTLNFKQAGDVIYLLGEAQDCIGSSEYVKRFHSVKRSNVPHFELDTEFALQRGISSIIKKKLVASVHDISEGGLFTCLLESAMTSDLGFVVSTDSNFRKDAYLFGESQSRVVVSVKAEKVADFENHVKSLNVAFRELGKVSNGDLAIDGQDYGQLSDWSALYNTTIENKLEK